MRRSNRRENTVSSTHLAPAGDTTLKENNTESDEGQEH